jgi:uracil-DNA glycosylase
VSGNGNFQAYYLRRIGVAAPLADAMCREAPPEALSGKPVIPIDKNAQAGELAALKAEAADCTACALSATRTQVVFGVGAAHADVVFIGEAPGEQEDLQGEPFVGKAGKLLDRMLAALGWSRESNVYIMNVIKCRPPKNRDPLPQEVAACSRWFDAQWELVQPKVVCLLGRVAAQRVLQSDAPLSSLRGRWHEYRGVPVWVTYHPAYLLRSPGGKGAAWQDLRKLAARVRSLKTD